MSHPVEVFTSRLMHTDVLKIRNPTEGLLYDFLLECGYDQQKFSNRLLSLILNEQSVELLSLLDQIDRHLLFKKHKKKLNKFKILIESEKKINQFKINYYIRFISRTVKQKGKVSTIIIKSLNTAENNFANCPETFITLGSTNKIYTSLLDSRAQSNILPWDIFQELEIEKDKITKIRHPLNLQRTTGVDENAIYGSLSLSLSFCLIKKTKF